MSKSSNHFYALGRRKSSTARIRFSSGKGSMVINGHPASEYLSSSKNLLYDLQRPFTVLELNPADFNFSAKVSGGGTAGQVRAIQLALAKSLSELNEDYRATLKRADLLGRDPRERERKKAGFLSARKKRQFTKR